MILKEKLVSGIGAKSPLVLCGTSVSHVCCLARKVLCHSRNFGVCICLVSSILPPLKKKKKESQVSPLNTWVYNLIYIYDFSERWCSVIKSVGSTWDANVGCTMSLAV